MSTLAGQVQKAWNFGSMVLNIGGVNVTAYGEDGGVEFEQGADLWEKTVGADGQVTYSFVNDDSVEGTITVMATSPAVLTLNAIIAVQIASVSVGGPIPPTPFTMFNPSTGDTVTAPFCVLMNRPNLSAPRSVPTREFRVSLVGAIQVGGITNGIV